MGRTNENIRIEVDGPDVTVNMTVEELYRWAQVLRALVVNNARTEFHTLDPATYNEEYVRWPTSDYAADYNSINKVLQSLTIDANDLTYRRF